MCGTESFDESVFCRHTVLESQNSCVFSNKWNGGLHRIIELVQLYTHVPMFSLISKIG